jgi:glycosyltransferase involved in cell wall biosynthesis
VEQDRNYHKMDEPRVGYAREPASRTQSASADSQSGSERSNTRPVDKMDSDLPASANKRVFLVWKGTCTRSQNQARNFGAEVVHINRFPGRRGFVFLAARYVVSFFDTLRELHARRPDVIFTINQPPPLILAIYLYTRLYGGIYLLDSHSAPFNDPKWAWARPLYRWIAARAFLNINTDPAHKATVERWGGRSVIMSDIPIEHDRDYPQPALEAPSVVVVSSFMFDEPTAEIWEAARLTPEVNYYVTGNPKKLPDALRDAQPDNVHLTGFVPTDDYFGLLSAASAVMVLTTRDNTMQCGAYEALSLEQPIITSNWKILRDSFDAAAVYVDNTPADVAAGVRRVIADHQAFKKAAREQRRRRRDYYFGVRDQILNEVGEAVQ